MNTSLTAFLSMIGVATLLAACAPATPPADSGDQQSSGAMMDQSSSTLIMEPGADGQEDEAMEPGADGQDDGGVVSGMPVPGSTVDEMIVSSEESTNDVMIQQEAATQKTRVIALKTSNFTFSPNAITVKKGEKITLRLTGMEGNHGFAIEALGINTSVPEGKTVDVPLPTDKAGTFGFRCSVLCGSGHTDMTGTITITE